MMAGPLMSSPDPSYTSIKGKCFVCLFVVVFVLYSLIVFEMKEVRSLTPLLNLYSTPGVFGIQVRNGCIAPLGNLLMHMCAL